MRSSHPKRASAVSPQLRKSAAAAVAADGNFAVWRRVASVWRAACGVWRNVTCGSRVVVMRRRVAAACGAAAAVATAPVHGCASCSIADEDAPCCFDKLPPHVARRIFALLPADARARAASVCSAWHQTLTAEPTAWQLWTELDLSHTSGVTSGLSDEMLESAAALARGRLRTLKLDDWDGCSVCRRLHAQAFTLPAVLRVLAANSHLEALSCAASEPLALAELQALLAAAPALQILNTYGVRTAGATAQALLRHEPPYAAVHVQMLVVNDPTAASPVRTAAGVLAFAADVAACGSESLQHLTLVFANLEAPAAIEALFSAALTHQLLRLHLFFCTFAPGVGLQQLARLLTDGRTAMLEIIIGDSPTLFEDVQEADVALLCDALLRNTTLHQLIMRNVGMTLENMVALAAAVEARPPELPELGLDLDCADDNSGTDSGSDQEE